MSHRLQAPFPYWGGKAAIAAQVWERLGAARNYIEPFAGSAAVLLARPDAHQWWDRIETINDADGYVANLWRAIQTAPLDVARHADWPANENDLHARHAWLLSKRESLTAALEGDPDYYDAKVAGWWLWGICLWIGSGWCSGEGPWRVVDGKLVRGETSADAEGINRQLPHLGNSGRGINRQMPYLGSGQGLAATWTAHLEDMMQRLSDRLRRVRVCSGDWSRICGPSPTENLGTTGVFLDPPYSQQERDSSLYRVEMATADAVREWAVAHGDDPLYRIALCGYDGEHAMPDGWEALRWKAKGGYGNQGDERGKKNLVLAPLPAARAEETSVTEHPFTRWAADLAAYQAEKAQAEAQEPVAAPRKPKSRPRFALPSTPLFPLDAAGGCYYYPRMETQALYMGECTCRVCGYQWVPRKPDPKQCPRCKRYTWRTGVMNIAELRLEAQNGVV